MLELARYISDDQAFFDSWFNSILTKSIELFPVPTDELDEKLTDSKMYLETLKNP